MAKNVRVTGLISNQWHKKMHGGEQRIEACDSREEEWERYGEWKDKVKDENQLKKWASS